MGQAECGLPSLVVEFSLLAWRFYSFSLYFHYFQYLLLIASCLIISD